MINIESELFAEVSKKVREVYPKIFMTGEYVMTPPSFPAISLIETENEVYRNGRSTSEIENFATVFYEVNVYSNKTSGRKTECKAIMSLVDDQMKRWGFTRTMLSPVSNLEDATIFRYVARYRAIVSKDHIIYRR